MTKLYKFSLKKICYSLVAIAFSIAITRNSEARNISSAEIYSTLTTDTIPKAKKDSLVVHTQADSILLNDTIPVNDSLHRLQNDSLIQAVDTFHLKLSKDTLDAPVEYEASDSGVLLVKEKKFLLYGKTKTTYKDINLTAPKVVLDQQTNILTAIAARDSVGNIIARAQFQQGTEGFQSDTIRYNFKTKRGLTMNTFTKQSEMFVNAPYIKKVNDSIAFAKHVTMTTCDLDDPHFGFVAAKAEFVTGKVAVTGPIHPEFEGVPLPIYLPFGVFPLKSGRHSGFLAPQFAATEQFGIGLEGLGYYHVLNDYMDVKLLTNIYSYGGWSAMVIPTYRKLYHYNGSLNFSIQRTKIAFKGDPDYALTKSFQISWNHSVDPKAARGTNFSANVNAGSTRFNQYVVNNPFRNFNNIMNSSIAYSKTWKGKPYNLTMSANHSQNSVDHLVNVTLPDAGFTVSTLYPFEKKDRAGAAKWYEKVGIGYSTVARNQISFYDADSIDVTVNNSIHKVPVNKSLGHLLDTMQWGAQHRFPISMSLPPLGPLIVSPFVSYEETWLTHRMRRRWDSAANKIDTISNVKGLFIDRQMSYGIGFNTSVYGLFPFKKGKVLIRHVMRPTFNMNYKPNMSKKFYDVIPTDSLSAKLDRRQPIPQVAGNNNLFSGYGYGTFGGITFGVDNNLEMKKKGRKDTVAKKIRLIEGFGFTSGYNFLQDSMQLSPFNLYFRTTLFEKLSISAQGLYSPYAQDSVTGQDTRQYVWQGDRFRLGRLRSGSVSMSTSFQSKPRDEKKAKTETPNNGTKITDPSVLGDEQRMQQYVNRNPTEFVDFNIPWSLSISYSLFFSRSIQYGLKKTNVTSNMSFNNTFSLTPKWMFTTSGYYDLGEMKLNSFTFSVSRDMHCWQLSVNVTPIGITKYFNITISPKSGILQDLKVNRTRYFYSENY
jgi:lipopolysaccharide assembly outer membrane protein LptD (OstA)